MKDGSGDVIRAILSHPLSWLILGSSLLAAWILDFWYILLLGLALEAWIFFSWLGSEKFRSAVQGQKVMRKLGEINSRCDAAIGSVWERSWGMKDQASPVSQVWKAKRGIWQAFSAAPLDMRLLMAEMVDLALKSAIGFVELYKNRKVLAASVSQAEIQETARELDRLKMRLSQAHDPEARAEYEKAVEYKQEEIAAYGRTLARIQAMEARMDKIEAALSGIRGKMAGVTAFEFAGYDREVSLLRTEAQALEGAVSEMSRL